MIAAPRIVSELRLRRLALGVSLDEVARELASHAPLLSRLERGLLDRPELRRRLEELYGRLERQGREAA